MGEENKLRQQEAAGRTGLPDGLDGLEIAERMAGQGKFGYTHAFHEPFEYEGNEYNELHFDWGRLTGEDALAIEREMQSMGDPVVIPSLSGGYLMRMAARACKENVGFDAFMYMSIRDYNTIRGKARSFLLKTEL